METKNFPGDENMTNHQSDRMETLARIDELERPC